MNRSSFASVAPFYLSSFAWNFALGMTYILIPLYARSLGMSGVQIGTLLALPVILQIVFSLIGGAFTDRVGGKKMAMAACVMTSLAGIVFMAAGSFAGMFAAQLLMVMARAMFWPATWSLATPARRWDGSTARPTVDRSSAPPPPASFSPEPASASASAR
jgi:MFS family permease